MSARGRRRGRGEAAQSRLGPLIAAALVTACALACSDAVLDARKDSPAAQGAAPPLARLPPDLDLRPEAQICDDDTSCSVTRGLPGQRPEALCCATCRTTAVALNLDNATRVAEWKRGLSCEEVACPAMGQCVEQRRWPTGAWCRAGICALSWP